MVAHGGMVTRVNTTAPAVPSIDSTWTRADLLGAWKVRWGFGRGTYRVNPGLYRIGDPGRDAPVIVTANYKLTFDVVRRDLAGRDAYLLVLDTRGVNVWCAAGKGTFGTDELVRRVMAANLFELVDHDTLVVPQLGATGVAGHAVQRACGYRVIWGPVDSADLPAFLDAGMKATPEMREVRFPFKARIVLAPVELTASFRGWKLAIPFALALLAGVGPGIWSVAAMAERAPVAVAVYVTGILAGAVGVPALLPWLPGRALSLKGAVVGLVASVGAGMLFGATGFELAGLSLVATAVSSYLGCNFTGSTTYTSPSGVEYELRRSIPLQAAAVILGMALWIASAWIG